MDKVLRSLENQVLTLKLNRVEKQNAISRDMYSYLADQLQEAAGDFGIRAVVVSHEGPHFTAGNDLFDFLNDPPLEPGSPVMRFLEQIHSFPKPLLAAVTGNAVGIGTTMLMHCDLVVASGTAKFSMPFVNLGLVPEAGSSILFPRLAGYQRAAKVFLTGESFGADFAKEIGLISQIADNPQELVSDYAAKISAQPPNAVIQTKALLKSELHDKVSAVMQAEGQLFQMALQSDEAKEAFMNFLSKKGK